MDEGAFLKFLRGLNTDKTSHSGRSLLDHLHGTYVILKSWGCEPEICIAGGLHSIYGTNAFKKQTLSSGNRDIIRQKFGERTERLVWLFGTINRPSAIELGRGVNRWDQTAIVIAEDDLWALRVIEAANLLEQGANLKKWPAIRKVAKDQIAFMKADFNNNELKNFLNE